MIIEKLYYKWPSVYSLHAGNIGKIAFTNNTQPPDMLSVYSTLTAYDHNGQAGSITMHDAYVLALFCQHMIMIKKNWLLHVEQVLTLSLMSINTIPNPMKKPLFSNLSSNETCHYISKSMFDWLQLWIAWADFVPTRSILFIFLGSIICHIVLTLCCQATN